MSTPRSCRTSRQRRWRRRHESRGGGGGLGIWSADCRVPRGQLPGQPAQQRPPQQRGHQHDVAVRCNQPGAIDQYDDCFITKIFNETNEIWAQPGPGIQAPHPGLLRDAASAPPAVRRPATPGPSTAPATARSTSTCGSCDQLLNRLGAEGRNAQAYVIAHEVGHHIQNITGQERKVRQLQQQNPGNKNQYSVMLELQADCYAGVWARQANDSGKVQITKEELYQALEAAAAVGDDRINPRASPGELHPRVSRSAPGVVHQGLRVRGPPPVQHLRLTASAPCGGSWALTRVSCACQGQVCGWAGSWRHRFRCSCRACARRWGTDQSSAAPSSRRVRSSR